MRIYSHYIRPYLSHPLNRRHKSKAILNFIKWQILLRISNWKKAWLIVMHECGFRIVVKKGQAGMTGNLYSGLMEFEEMMFVIQFLQTGDVFFDIGSNVGIYTLLASALKGANSYSFEPVPKTFHFLKMNVAVNNLENKVCIYQKAVGDRKGKINMSSDLDAMNKILSASYDGTAIETEVITLDELFLNFINAPTLLKIDTEGYEVNVLRGAAKLLDNEFVKAILIEMNEAEAIQGIFSEKGFIPYVYDPVKREMLKADHLKYANLIYIRDIDFVRNRIKEAPVFVIRGQKF